MNIFLLCFKIFLARIADVTLGTIRTMYIVKGKKLLATSIAFFEVMIWFFAAREALSTELTTSWIVISYAGGFALGNYLGMVVNDFFIHGTYVLQIISDKFSKEDIDLIKKNNFGISTLNMDDKKQMIYISLNKKRYNECVRLINCIDSKAFIIVSESKVTHNGYIKKSSC